MTPEDIRREIVTAIFLHDPFFERMALKGGTALELAQQIGSRSSLDVDISLDGDFQDVEETGRVLQGAITEHFSGLGLTVFDFKFGHQPPHRPLDEIPAIWGGYRAEFKLLKSDEFAKLTLERARWSASETKPGGARTFKVDISRYEYIGATEEVEMGTVTWKVYKPILLLCEKLRALCQQDPNYASKMHSNRKRRPNDFLDIYEIMQAQADVLGDEEVVRTTLRECFRAKDVPLNLLVTLASDETHDFHEAGWDAVVQATSRELEPFEVYHAFVADLSNRLQQIARNV